MEPSQLHALWRCKITKAGRGVASTRDADEVGILAVILHPGAICALLVMATLVSNIVQLRNV
jgi:hypothetical protein